MKTTALLLSLLFSYASVLAQDAKQEAETIKTKMDVFASQTGIITKFTDSNLDGIKSNFGVKAETRIRKVNSGSTVSYFYQIEKVGKYVNTTASIEHSDLLELLKAIEVLKSQEEKDIISNPDYLENKFITEDGFAVGYYINKEKSTWYLRLEKYGSDKTLFVKDAEIILASFLEASNKIDQLKSE
jgi:hypothetical protein